MLNKHIFISLLLFWIPFAGLKGQADSILRLSKELQGEALWIWYHKSQSTDTARFFRQLDEMVPVFQKNGAAELARDAWVLKVILKTSYNLSTSSIEQIDRAIDDARDKGWKVQEITLLYHKGITLYNRGKQVAGFANMMKCYEMMSDLGFEKFSYAKEILLNIGHAYFGIGDYDHAIRYMRESTSIPEANQDPIFQLGQMNSVGVCYMKMMKYDSAILFFTKAHQIAEDIQHEFWMGLTNGNIGNSYFKKGQDDKALPLLETDFNTSLRHKQYGSALNAALSLANIYLKKGNSTKAEYYIRFSEEHVDRNDDNAMATYYDNLYLLSKMKGEYRQATENTDSARVYRNRYLANQDQSIIEKAKLQIEMEKHAGELKLLEATRKRQVVLRNAMLAILILSGIIASLLINRRYLKRKKELDLAHAELHHYTDTIRKKNELIDSFTDELEKTRIYGIHHEDERTEQLQQLINVSLLTEDDWKHFKQLFDKVHPGFIIRLKEKITDLSPAELRLLALTKLQLAPREMASMLGISYESIKKSRQRLRKKIHLSEEGSLDELVDMI